ncbi:MAG: ABC transporter ATP-binding protein, partial [Dehalococcoidia bacterium]
GLLALDTASVSQISVYLSESLEDPRQPGVALPNGYAVPRRMEIHALFQRGTAITSLERPLAVLMLTVALGDSRSPAPLFVDGLLALALQRSGNFANAEQVATTVGQARTQGKLPPILSLFDGSTPETQAIYFAAAASFVSYLLRTYGAEKVTTFLRLLPDSGPERAARSAFRRRLERIEREWQATLPGSTPARILWSIKLCLSYLRPYKFKVTEIMLYIAMSVGFGTGLAKMQGILLDKALIPGDRRVLAELMAIIIVAFIVVSIGSVRQAYLMAWTTGSVVRDLSRRMFTLIQRLHLGFFHTWKTGDIISRSTSDLGQIETVMSSGIAAAYRTVLTVVFALTLIVLEDWRLSLLALIGAPLFFLTGRWLAPVTARASLQRQQHLGELVSALQENLTTLPVIKAFGLHQRMIDDFVVGLNKLFRSSLRVTFLSSIYGVSANSIVNASTLTLLGVGGWLVTDGSMSVGSLITFMALLVQIMGPMQSVSNIYQSLSRASGSLARVQELLNAEPAIQDRPDARPVAPLAREIRFENVTFSYTGQPVINNVSFSIPAGRRVALVGPSGCGKSTTLGLLMRFYDPNQGRVTLDGTDLRDATEESLRDQMGMVLQESVLFHLSIRENIRLGNLDATDAEIIAAAKAAEIHDLIESLPEGYDTLVGERGGRLSGGQRQRVAIARAIVRNPAILLLDEATSALDPATEAAINKTLNTLAQGRTTIFVTHRLSSVVTADMIYVLDQGRMVEQGTHSELLAHGGVYAHLWQQQGGGVEPEPALQPAGT